MRLVLASASPRRRQLLARLGVDFEVRPVDIDETPRPDEDAATLVRRLALEKAQRGLELELGTEPLDHVVAIGSDTVVSVDGVVLGKPADEADAVRMLQLLSGSTHQVLTGVAVAAALGTAARLDVEVATTEVTMRALHPEDIQAWIATGEAMDKAGAYAIQEVGDAFVTRIDGGFDTVVGLPVALTGAMLADAGLVLPQPPDA